MISVRGLSKSYTIRHNVDEHITIAEFALGRLKRPFRRARTEEFWALQEIDFDVRCGEVLGLIGRNGAGKSTLLKILTRITEPTKGRVDLWGRVGSLLEVGTGFHPELTGRENVYLNGSILGMSRKEIARQFDAIVDFAGVEQFLDTPVKRYSSGMYVRLAFAVAAHLDVEILLVDEVLAVGDREFQWKCLGKMQDVAGSGRTVLFVSHQMEAVVQLCSRAIVLERGGIVADGPVDDAVAAVSALTMTSFDFFQRRGGSGELRVSAAEGIHPRKVGQPYFLEIAVTKHKPVGRFFISFHIVDSRGAVVLQCDSRLHDQWFDPDASERLRIALFGPMLKPGRYRVDLFICAMGVIDRIEGIDTFEVPPILPFGGTAPAEALVHGSVFPDFSVDIASVNE